MTKVYVVNKGCHDYSKAEKYGKVTYLSVGNFKRYSTGKMYRIFTEKLDSSNQDDWIIVSGLTIMVVIACSIFVHKHKRLNLLIYNNRVGVEEYIKRKVIL